jgi:isoamyl acetate esterase
MSYSRSCKVIHLVTSPRLLGQCFAKQHEQHHVPKVRLLAIWFGTNDAAILPSAQHVPLPRFIVNMKGLVHMITQPTSPHYSPNTRIALITPPPVNTYQRGALLAQRDPPINLDRDFEVTRQYAIAVKDVGIDEGVAVVDVWTKIWDAAGQEERELERFLWDGIHLNAEGYQVSALV